LAGKEGITVRCGVAAAAGLAAGGGVEAVAGFAGVVEGVEDAGLAAVVVEGFAAVVVVAAAFDAGLAHAERTEVDEMSR
jgi:hypothetical protein